MSKSFWSKSLIIILIFQAIASFVFVAYRTMDADEGFYLAAAQRVADGMMPYTDFFFPQMPLLPLTFFSLANWGISSIFILRAIAALAGLIMTMLIYRIVRANTETHEEATVAAFLTAFSGLSLTWHSTFKPYAFVDLFLLLSYGLLFALKRERETFLRYVFLMTLSLAVAINFRSIFALLVPFYYYHLIREGRAYNLPVGKALLASAAGLIIPSIPAIVLFVRGSSDFVFNNLIFHLQREPINPVSALILHKLTVVGKFFALPQTILLVGAAVMSWLLLKYKQVAVKPFYRQGLFMALLIGLIYLIPTPIHLQYFQQTLPYLIIAGLPAVAFIVRYEKMRAILRSASLLYIVGIFPFIYLFILSPREQDQRFTWPQLQSVVAQIHDNSSTGDTLLSEWAGYAALSERQQMPSSEHVGFHFPLKIDKGQYRSHHLLTNDDIVEALNQRRPELVVVDYQIYPEWQQALAANYHLVDSVAKTFIYKKNHETM